MKSNLTQEREYDEDVKFNIPPTNHFDAIRVHIKRRQRLTRDSDLSDSIAAESKLSYQRNLQREIFPLPYDAPDSRWFAKPASHSL